MKRFLYNSAVIVTIAVVLYVYNSNLGPQKSAMQREYETWLQGTEVDLFYRRSSKEATPRITIKLLSSLPTMPGTWTLALSPKNDSKSMRDKIIRILQLVREADLFARKDRPQQLDQMLTFVIEGSGKTFQSYIFKDDTKSNVRLQTLMRLFKIYTAEMVEPKSAIASIATSPVVSRQSDKENPLEEK
ncbi:hypothetical protein OAO01_06360 [Oligoflexia bacterium]|nr:hypothetical protein [Oligoflexia bacterium]